MTSDRTLEQAFPELAAQWHPTLNEALTPADVAGRGNAQVWWQCPNDAAHAWETSVSNRSLAGTGCPRCLVPRASLVELGVAAELDHLLGVDRGTVHIRVPGQARAAAVDIVLPSNARGLTVVDGPGVVVEYDGAYWHRDTQERDTTKTARLLALGWTVIRVRERPLEALAVGHTVVVEPGDVYGAAAGVLRQLEDLNLLDGAARDRVHTYLAAGSLVGSATAERWVQQAREAHGPARHRSSPGR